eukprot:CAMPEP_0172787952 /NCGR_PEP_ID=MMETSP1074-20121228/206709_1 /TAXON_ID=2916 /ORGANISM="Ceratium fusus, Strain PA161109" /LENGTH=656 /DNA_ID=CAMNT_0013624973 /DNA_START=1 /DNA_END=1967 /DNA_ORIENTATION=+
MNVNEFSKLLKTLFEEAHDRAVEQYAKADAVRCETSQALIARQPSKFMCHSGKSESNASPIWQAKPAMPAMLKGSSSDACPDDVVVGFNDRLNYPPHAEGDEDATTAKWTRNSGFPCDKTQVLHSVTPVSEEDIVSGRCFTVPDERHVPSPRYSLTNKNAFSERDRSWVINPGTAAMRYWDGIIFMALAYVALVCPIQVALMEAQFDALFVLNCVVDCFFIVDMVLQFFLMYRAETGSGTMLEHRQSRIVARYLKTWFLIDFLSVIPFDLLALLIQSSGVMRAKGVKAVRLLRLVKMVRIAKASRIFKRLDDDLLITNTQLTVVDLHMFILWLALISHWVACTWALTFSLVGEDSVRWVDTFETAEMNVEKKTKDSVWKLYVAALYFTAYTMTGVGYGDVTPVNIVERIVCIPILFVSGFVWACVIGQVTGIVSKLGAHEQEFKALMDNLNAMMKDRQLPWPVRKRVKTFFLSARQAQRNEQQELILRRMSPFLQGEVALRSNWQWVKKVSFICNLVHEPGTSVESSDMTRIPYFVVDISLALESAIFAQSEVFGAQQTLYILKRGLALSGARSGMRVFCAGDVWGEDLVLSKSSLRDSRLRLAVTYLEIFQLTFASFSKVCHRHRSNMALRKRLRQFVARLSARRAILLEARRRR